MAECNIIPWSSDSAIVPAEAVEDMRKLNLYWNSVPLIRCRDCKDYSDYYSHDPCCYHFDGYGSSVEPNGFCAWAVRRHG